MTENEARQKWCPVARATCLASRCMMWRWVRMQNNPPEKRLGYCGLARKDDSVHLGGRL